jgi:hypothetical protein
MTLDNNKAQAKSRYKVDSTSGPIRKMMQDSLDKHDKEGWKFVGMNVDQGHYTIVYERKN